ncbi:hypothetical protein NQ318_003545 [Aromia moschata]|uniref:Fibronectin type-III domain-containing protein n=1 Tax=Aromia moschata TaxID=1265417 RepID=A0AAV8YVD2_9CUCU|nr:hypothetical protein NQ318_003545 [Aromia moschata]
MLNFQPGLRHRIWYQSDFNKNVWEYGGLITTYPEKNSGPVEFDLENLKYPHALYDIRVSMMSKVADENDENMWSDNATITVRAQSKIPDHPPKTDIGSFESFYNRFTRDIYVYWQQLAEEEHNGQNFSYEVEVVNDPSLRPKDITKTYAYFSNVSFSTDYIINIRSRNDIGPSLEKSTVVVPTKGWQQPPSNFMKVEDFRNNDHIIYNLSWSPPKESPGSGKLPQSGSLNWTTLPDSLLEYRTVLPATNHVYQFAISANYHNTSSGMQWAECTAFSATIGKNSLIAPNRHLGPITGYIIYYCPIDKPSRPSCKGPEKNTTVPYDSKIQSAVVGGLESYVTYRFTISFIINHTTYSEPSDVCTNTTREAAPSTPQNIVVRRDELFDITQMDAASEKKRRFEEDKKQEMPVEPDKTDITIQNLMSFEKYKITMEACTVDCSNKTDPIEVTTQMWVPSKIENVQEYSTNETHITFAWHRPVPARGKIDYYQVDYTQTFNSETKKFPYINVTSKNFSIENCESGKYTKVQVIIRAVNIINGRHVAGPWSNPRDYYCQIRLFTPLIYILGGALSIFAVVMVSCCFKRVYVSIKDMKNIGVELPPGLHQKVNTTDTLKSMNKISADEVMPLNKMMKEGMRSSGDSSGLGSAHDSIASSEESTNHISPSDSGTEQPRSPSLSEDRKNSLRQRNKQANMKPSTINKGYVLPDAVPLANWSPKPSPATGRQLLRIGSRPYGPDRD